MKNPNDLVFVCDCGCKWFFLIPDGIECVRCSATREYKSLPDGARCQLTVRGADDRVRADWSLA
jgi:hypothetical protein